MRRALRHERREREPRREVGRGRVDPGDRVEGARARIDLGHDAERRRVDAPTGRPREFERGEGGGVRRGGERARRREEFLRKIEPALEPAVVDEFDDGATFGDPRALLGVAARDDACERRTHDEVAEPVGEEGLLPLREHDRGPRLSELRRRDRDGALGFQPLARIDRPLRLGAREELEIPLLADERRLAFPRGRARRFGRRLDRREFEPEARVVEAHEDRALRDPLALARRDLDDDPRLLGGDGRAAHGAQLAEDPATRRKRLLARRSDPDRGRRRSRGCTVLRHGHGPLR